MAPRLEILFSALLALTAACACAQTPDERGAGDVGDSVGIAQNPCGSTPCTARLSAAQLQEKLLDLIATPAGILQQEHVEQLYGLKLNAADVPVRKSGELTWYDYASAEPRSAYFKLNYSRSDHNTASFKFALSWPRRGQMAFNAVPANLCIDPQALVPVAEQHGWRRMKDLIVESGSTEMDFYQADSWRMRLGYQAGEQPGAMGGKSACLRFATIYSP